MTKQINPRTPVIIGVGQYQMDVPEDLSSASGPIEITARAIEVAVKDSGVSDIASRIDRLTSIRLFGDSGPVFPCPFGTSTNMPLSIAKVAGVRASTLIYSKLGGEQPQVQIAETARALQQGDAEVAIVCGGEAIANMKAASRQGVSLDWSDDPKIEDGAEFIDHGFVFSDLPIAPEEMRHSLINAIMVYAMMETARRLRLGLSVEDYQKRIGKLFEPFSKAAAQNPYSMFKDHMTASDIARPSDTNPMIASPYTKAMVAKDGVNQSAAVIMTTIGKAKALGIPEENWVFLNGYAKGEEPLVSNRADIDRFPVLETLLENTLSAVGLNQSDVSEADFYSCFPIVVFSATEVMSQTKVKTYTLTGGLPFFGGPGNNYSLHAIAEMVKALRGTDKYGLIHANGGVMTKHAIGIYSTHPTAFAETYIDEDTEKVSVETSPNGVGALISFCLNYRKGQAINATLLLKMENGSHALAKYEGELERLHALKSGQPFMVRVEKHHNVAELA